MTACVAPHHPPLQATGVLGIGLASWALSYPGAILRAVPETGLEVVLAGGFCLITAAIFGAYGSLNRSRYTLRIFAVVAAVFIVLQVVGGIVTVSWIGDKDAVYLEKVAAGAFSLCLCVCVCVCMLLHVAVCCSVLLCAWCLCV